MKRGVLGVGVLGAVLASTACKEERSERVAASYSTWVQRTERALPKPQPQKLTVGQDAIPAEEDYEVRAASTITEANLQTKLAELEHELQL